MRSRSWQRQRPAGLTEAWRTAGGQCVIDLLRGLRIGTFEPCQEKRFGSGKPLFSESVGERLFAGGGKVVLAGLGEQQCFRTRGRDQRPEGIAGQVGVVQITGHGGGIGGRRTELQLREKESPVGVVAATVDSCQQTLADIVTQRFVRRVGHIGHHAVKGVFERGVLALVGRDEHGGDHLDTLASGGRPVRPSPG